MIGDALVSERLPIAFVETINKVFAAHTFYPDESDGITNENSDLEFNPDTNSNSLVETKWPGVASAMPSPSFQGGPGRDTVLRGRIIPAK